jgi:hypothetical protein
VHQVVFSFIHWEKMHGITHLKFVLSRFVSVNCMTFAQRRHRQTTHFPERNPAVKRRVAVFVVLTFWRSAGWQSRLEESCCLHLQGFRHPEKGDSMFLRNVCVNQRTPLCWKDRHLKYVNLTFLEALLFLSLFQINWFITYYGKCTILAEFNAKRNKRGRGWVCFTCQVWNPVVRVGMRWLYMGFLCAVP